MLHVAPIQAGICFKRERDDRSAERSRRGSACMLRCTVSVQVGRVNASFVALAGRKSRCHCWSARLGVPRSVAELRCCRNAVQEIKKIWSFLNIKKNYFGKIIKISKKNNFVLKNQDFFLFIPNCINWVCVSVAGAVVLVVSTVAGRPDENGSFSGLKTYWRFLTRVPEMDYLLPTPRPLRPKRAPSTNACWAISRGPSTFLPSSSGPHEAE